MQRLSGLDASFLYNETPTLHMHTLKVAVLETGAALPEGRAFLLEEIGRRLHLLPPFRRRLVDVPGGLHHPVWIEDPDFDLEFHIRQATVPHPGTPTQMDALIAEIASRPLDRTRPLWELHVLEGRADGRLGVLIKLHHAAADGVAASALLANVMDATPDAPAPEPPPWHPEEVPGAGRLLWDTLVDHLAQLRELPLLVGTTAGGTAAALRVRRDAERAPPRPVLDTPRTSFNAALTPHRSFATTVLSLDRLRAVKQAHGVTLNDVVLAVVSGAVRAYLLDRGEFPGRSLVAGVPTSTGTMGGAVGGTGRLGGNEVSNLFTTLATDHDDPVARLRAISAVTATAKNVQNVLGATLMEDWMAFAPPRPYAWFMRQYSRWRVADRHPPPINLVVSNVPGPREPLYAAGARLAKLYSVGPILEGVGLNITVWSYLDELFVGILACREQVPDPAVLATRLDPAVVELEAASLTPPGSAPAPAGSPTSAPAPTR